ncbi:hypothetical protein DXA01_13765 [Bacteroides caccae]|jgi:hypothetical protein|nr:hypothetical protein DXA01_13765 [Bacteroides caccae]
MMKDKEKQEKFEAFKAGILKWKNEHREEYNEFARIMTNCDETFYYQIFKAVIGQMRHIAREWELSWGDDGDETFDSIFILVSRENLPQKISEMFSVAVPDTERKCRWMNIARRMIGMKPNMKVRLSAPLLLSWLFYGKSFESMMAMLEKQMSNPHIERIDRMKCSLASRSVIAVSIKGGYRTKEDWERYFAMENANKDGDTGEWALRDAVKDIDSGTEAAPLPEAATENVQHLTPGRKKSKACPLIDYLPADSGEAVISYIRSYVITHQSAMLQALPYFVLKEMPLRLPLLNGVEYATAMTRQFPDVSELLSEHSLRQAVGKLAGTETLLLEKDSKKQMCRYIESDANQKLIEQLRNDIGKII